MGNWESVEEPWQAILLTVFDGYLNVLAKDTSTGLGSMITKEAIM